MTDYTGNMIFGTALEKVVRGCGLVDVWETVPPTAVFTHYTWNEEAHPDRIYVTSSISGQKVEVETVFAAVTDHLAVRLRIKLEDPLLQ
jgi:endonuclease/exonuclease/phosphatase family metal-dependent hydrolase